MSTERTWPSVLSTLLAGHDLGRDDTAWAMDRVMSGEADPVPLAGFLVALRAKGETVEELHGLVDAMLAHAVRIEVEGPCVDVVGTGGDRRNTVNISTMAALVNLINEERREHNLTIEDPIEYVHVSKRCLVNQRSAGDHTHSVSWSGTTATMPPPTPLLHGNPMRKANSPAAS